MIQAFVFHKTIWVVNEIFRWYADASFLIANVSEALNSV